MSKQRTEHQSSNIIFTTESSFITSNGISMAWPRATVTQTLPGQTQNESLASYYSKFQPNWFMKVHSMIRYTQETHDLHGTDTNIKTLNGNVLFIEGCLNKTSLSLCLWKTCSKMLSNVQIWLREVWMYLSVSVFKSIRTVQTL